MLLFVYGSLLDASLREQVLKRKVSGIPLTVFGYRACNVRGLTYPALLKLEGGHVSGEILIVSEPEKILLDEYEGTSEGEYVLAEMDFSINLQPVYSYFPGPLLDGLIDV